MNRKKKPSASATSESGFACLYFLVLFLLCTLLAGIAMTNLQNRIRTAINIHRANELLSEEACVLAWLRCELENERPLEGNQEANGITFHVSASGNGLRISITDPYPEVLQVTLGEEDRTVYDYEVIRNEEPA